MRAREDKDKHSKHSIWIVSIYLEKAFDRVEHRALMTVRQAHELGGEYISLLVILAVHGIYF